MAETKTTVEDVLTPTTEETTTTKAAEEVVETADTKTETPKAAEKKTGGRKKVETVKAEPPKVDEAQDTASAEEVQQEDAALTEETATPAEETKQEVPAAQAPATEIATGAKVETNVRIRLYGTQNATTPIQTIKGRFYIWDNKTLNGRVRLTDSPSGVSTPGRCIGWVDTTAIANCIK